MTRLIEPVLIFTVAVIIGAIVVMMYLPIFDLASGVL
jgi:general secretion pathway protein F